MSHANPRAVAAPLIIAAAVIAAGHMMIVDPAKRTLAQARAQSALRDEETQRIQTVAAALPALTAASEQAQRAAAAIALASTPATDPGALFATLATLASEHHVRVDQLDPFTPRRPAAPAPASPTDPAATLPPADAQLGYSMTVVATYSDLAAFLGALQSDLGYTRILSVRLAPSPEAPETVSARIQTVHHAFAVPPLNVEGAR